MRAILRLTFAAERTQEAPLGAALRADLDRLVLNAIIPERARNAAGPSGDVKPATETMTAEWEHLKSQWN